MLPGFATTFDCQRVIPFQRVANRFSELAVEMTCRVQLAFERSDEFRRLPVNVELDVLHDNPHPCRTVVQRPCHSVVCEFLDEVSWAQSSVPHR